MSLLKTAENILKPIAQTIVNMNIAPAAKVKAIQSILKGIQGKGYGIALQQVNEGTIERLTHDLGNNRVNLNIIPTQQLLEEVATMQPARSDKYRQFINMAAASKVVQADRPSVQLGKLSNTKTFHLLYTKGDYGFCSIRAVVIVYGSSLTSWADRAELKMTHNDLSRWPSTHYIDQPSQFVKVFQPSQIVKVFQPSQFVKGFQ